MKVRTGANFPADLWRRIREAAIEAASPPPQKQQVSFSIIRERDELSMQVDRERRMTRTIAMLNDYSHGESINSICDKYECSKTHLLRLTKVAGFPPRHRGFRPEIKQAVLDAYLRGDSLENISKTYDVSPAYISKTAKAEQLPMRNVVTKKRAPVTLSKGIHRNTKGKPYAYYRHKPVTESGIPPDVTEEKASETHAVSDKLGPAGDD